MITASGELSRRSSRRLAGTCSRVGGRSPEHPYNWALYVFYGGDIREAELPWLLEQIQSIAALPPADDDGDMPVGLFAISDERAAVTAWEIRDGRVRDRPAPELPWVLR